LRGAQSGGWLRSGGNYSFNHLLGAKILDIPVANK